ncbi:helix-turn-helix transcriptional regulator [Amedibacterium intestinale]|uniref:helix-turn-helix transcriptional regulator n=1 Tax=Amedibacterium intestinale TaxID=2583452 RepID=UPI000E203D3E
MNLRNNVKIYRVRLDINQQQLGTLVEVSRQTISLIERGDYNPSITLALKLAKVFDCKVEDLFYLEGEDNEKD